MAGDVGKKVRVKVSFTDDRDNTKGPLTSDAYPTPESIIEDAKHRHHIGDRGIGPRVHCDPAPDVDQRRNHELFNLRSIERHGHPQYIDARRGRFQRGRRHHADDTDSSTAAAFLIATANDSTDDNDVTFTVTLISASGATISGPAGSAKGTITDDKPIVSSTTLT